jgi:outer membrane protein TolC
VTAREEARRATALLAEARAASLPSLAATGIYTRLESDRLFNGNVMMPRDGFNAALTASVPLVNPQRWAQWSHARDAEDVSVVTLVDARRTAALAVARAYLGVATQRHLIDANKHARDTSADHLAFVHTRLGAGFSSELDEARAAQELALNEAVLRSSAANLVRAREGLGVLLGAEGPVDTAEETAIAEPPPIAVALAGVSRRSDVVALDARLVAARHLEDDDWTDYAPTLAAVGQAFYQTPPTPLIPRTGWQVQIVLSVPLYDGGLRYGLRDERSAAASEARSAAEAGVRQARSDVRAAYEALTRADESLTWMQQAFAASSRALDLADRAYQAGRMNNLDVIEAERQLHLAEASLVLARDADDEAKLDALAAAGRFP